MPKETQLKNFLKTNHHIVMSYHDRYYQYITCSAKTKYDRIRSLFLNALEAAGGSVPLDAKYASYKYFSKTKREYSAKDFARVILGNIFVIMSDMPLPTS